VLGNAHLTNFFVNDGNISELELALKAYAQTERNLKEPNPDLYYNRATIYEYLERYSEAVKDYNLAHSIDPNLKSDYKSGQIINFVVQTANFVQSRGKSQQKRLLDLVKSVPTSLPGELRFPQVEEKKQSIVYKIASVADLSPGINEGAILPAKVV
jgi:tetratricopeptide (TPR) repeat protein